MLVLLGPPFSGTDEQFARLAQMTGLVAYDLRTKLKADQWGVVRVLADVDQALELAGQLRQAGFRIALVDSDVAHDPNRPIVVLRSIELGAEHMLLHLRERTMPVPYKALLTIVRGEVQVGQAAYGTGRSSPPSSATFRAVVPTAGELEIFRESVTAAFDTHHAADLHFTTVLWAARIDVRSFDFTALGSPEQSPARSLDELVDWLGEQCGVRVDRGSRHTSLASFAARPPPMRSASPVPSGPAAPRASIATGDERFSAYSRLLAEAERQTRPRGA
jgi:hypothetical protein